MKDANAAYKNQGKKFLEKSFPLISCKAIDTVLRHVGYSFPQAFRILSTIQQEYPNGDARRAFPTMPLAVKVFLKNPRPKPKKRLYVRHPKLLDEISAFMRHEAQEQAGLAGVEPGQLSESRLHVDCTPTPARTARGTAARGET